MNNPLISVIMSTYNETLVELNKSLNSILNQTYENIEFIIVNDNPGNSVLANFMKSVNDPRVRFIINDSNMGLVASLNKALSCASGEYIARMDADDIAIKDRLEKQLEYLVNNKLDMVGSDIELIDENDIVIKKKMHFPSNEKSIRKYIVWGSCMAHPTWLVKREVYTYFNGYRNVPYCEDYDFLLRVVLDGNYRMGNISNIYLKYRVRNEGISTSNANMQYLVRRYLSIQFKKKHVPLEKDIRVYLSSDEFRNSVEDYSEYIRIKRTIKTGALYKIFLIIFNKNLYYDLYEKINLYLRERT